jgi:hypothetical protein
MNIFKLILIQFEDHYSSAPLHLSNMSYRLGRELKFTGDYEKFANDPENHIMLTRKYRKHYVVSLELKLKLGLF